MSPIAEFEKKIAEFFGAPFAVALDSCTHGVELCLRLLEAEIIVCPKRTYLSIPMLANKLKIQLKWIDSNWKDYYSIYPSVYDAAVFWKKDGYIPGTFMNISFQYRKHLSLGRGGVILCDNKEHATVLKKMSYDGRVPDVLWRDQDVDTLGYHYYMTPETAELGLEKLPHAINTPAMEWGISMWPDLTQLKVFK